MTLTDKQDVLLEILAYQTGQIIKRTGKPGSIDVPVALADDVQVLIDADYAVQTGAGPGTIDLMLTLQGAEQATKDWEPVAD